MQLLLLVASSLLAAGLDGQEYMAGRLQNIPRQFRKCCSRRDLEVAAVLTVVVRHGVDGPDCWIRWTLRGKLDYLRVTCESLPDAPDEQNVFGLVMCDNDGGTTFEDLYVQEYQQKSESLRLRLNSISEDPNCESSYFVFNLTPGGRYKLKRTLEWLSSQQGHQAMTNLVQYTSQRIFVLSAPKGAKNLSWCSPGDLSTKNLAMIDYKLSQLSIRSKPKSSISR
eukprot:Lankesteria_metandrocarpae@DN7794_c0_g1_i1.p1